MPHVSVIMACHNGALYVRQAIESVITQTYRNVELIFVDDQSDDDSMAIANSLARNDKRIRIFSTGRKSGAAAARNLAISKAAGEWLAVLDADDVFIANKCEEQLNHIHKFNRFLVLLGTQSYEIDEEGKRCSVQSYPCVSHRLKANLLRMKRFPPHSSLMYRSSAVKQMGGFNDRFLRAQDADLCLRLMSSGEFSCLSESLVEYRNHRNNNSRCIAPGGYSSLEYGLAARVCFLLRQRSGLPDPSCAQYEGQWDTFMCHVRNSVSRSGQLECRRQKKELKLLLHEAGGIVRKSRILAQFFLGSPIKALMFIRSQWNGSQLPQRCFTSWRRVVREGQLEP